MTPAIRSEFRKFFTTRLWWGMALATFLAAAAFAVLYGVIVNNPAAFGGPGGGHRRRWPSPTSTKRRGRDTDPRACTRSNRRKASLRFPTMSIR